ncbi:ABC transporter permease [Thalassolituus maritimus]|jgi:NitT/TauT family transport system permease protein|uniref:ABC transporter permease n=1 Tax=Thalassolituus maritimus TaxID=484498 RepID=A0ABP9ZWX1_9GAMM
MNRSQLLGIHARPGRTLRIILTLLPFFIVIAAYLIASDIRLTENPSDKLLPSFDSMIEAVERVAFTADRRTGEYILWQDTLSSLSRLALGLGLATVCALFLGLNMGAFPGFAAASVPFMTTLAMVPPLAVLPILFISLGIGELGKVALIFLGTFPLMARDVYMAVKRIPTEQITKALTLGASELAVTYKIILPQIMPRLLSSLRLSLGAAWLFLIAAEAIAASEGLGYRIFLVRRYLSMDVIIPYVLWITFLGFAMDYCLRMIIKHRYKWYRSE